MLIRNKCFQFTLLAAVAVVMIYAVARTMASPPLSDAAVGDEAPSFELTALNGDAIRLTDYEGKGVVLNFWASWCNPCVNELPLLNEAYKLAGIDMVAINVGEDADTIRKFAERYDLAFPIALDEEMNAKMQYRASGLPLTVLIDQRGHIVKRHEGELTDMSDIMQFVNLDSDSGRAGGKS
ncbi:redoxin domain-containing protein [Paenibacillus sp. strain BS8-2]